LSLLCVLSLSLSFSVFAPPAFAADVIKLKFANYFPPPAPHSKICEDFIADLEKRTNGRVKVQYFAGGSLLKATNMYEGVVTGISDIGLAHVEYTPGRFPVTEVCDLPLGYPSGWVFALSVSSQNAGRLCHGFSRRSWFCRISGPRTRLQSAGARHL
jgi:TRAP-type C4-dicarboxylate transport system substrate-binding protein